MRTDQYKPEAPASACHSTRPRNALAGELEQNSRAVDPALESDNAAALGEFISEPREVVRRQIVNQPVADEV